MKTRNLLLAGTIIAGPLLSLAIQGGARAEGAPGLRLAQQAEPGAPGERRERGGPQREAPREAQPQREAPPQRQAPPPRAEPPRAEPPRAEPPRAAEPQRAEPPRAEPPQRAEPPRERPQAAPPAPERREPPQAAPERREPPRAEPPRERPQTPPGLERQPSPAPAPERREAPAAPRAEPPRSVTPPAAPAERPAERAAPRPEATPAPAPAPAPAPRPESAPAQRPAAPAVPPSATQPRPDLGGRPDATPQQRAPAPTAPPPASTTAPAQRAPAPTAPAERGPAAPSPNVAPQGLAPPQPRGDIRPADRTQDRGGQTNDRRVEERDGRTYIRENDNRLIIREGDRDIIRHDEVERLRRGARDIDVQQRPNGRREIVIVRPDGDRIVSIVDQDGNLLRRERRARDGRTYVLIENDFDRPRGGFYRPVELPPLRLNIPRERYIVEAEDAPYDVIERTLSAPPVERVERAYSLDEVRYNQRLREKMSRVDVDTINFEFGSAEVDPNGAARLDSIARALLDAIRRNPNEVFLIEGHTDAVGGDTENLTLSDRRAESVAAILTERYQIPPENLVTQGYGEQFLKVQTQAPERQNRRVTVRRITPLLQQGQNQAPPPR